MDRPDTDGELCGAGSVLPDPEIPQANSVIIRNVEVRIELNRLGHLSSV